jgi:hypothetical protein
MNTPNVKKSAQKLMTPSINELNQLVFWAKIGLKKVKGGSYYPEVLETIKEFEKHKANR